MEAKIAATTVVADVSIENTETLGALRRFSGSPIEFWQAYLDALSVVCLARRSLLLARKDGNWQALQQWPPRATGAPADAAQAKRLADTAATRQVAVESMHRAGNSGAALAVRLEVDTADHDMDATVLVILLKEDAADRAHSLLPVLRLAADIPAHYELHREHRKTHGSVERLFDVISLAIRMGNERRFMKAALFLCNELAARFNCDRIALGWLEGAYIKLQAISHIESFDRKMAAAQQLESVMEEAFDQDEDVVYPKQAGSAVVVRAHDLYARTQGAGHLASLPLRVADQPEAVMMAERRSRPFSDTEIWEMRLICDAGATRLSALHHQDRWIGSRLAAYIKTTLDSLWGVNHSLAKLVGLILMATVIILAIVDWPYRVETAFTLRSQDLMFMPAPFDGYLREVHREIGDRVEAGELVVELNTSELTLEEAMAAAEVNRYAREAEKAQAGRLLADMQIALARQKQSEARLELVRHQLANAKVKAPMAGIVVEGDLKKNLGAPVRKGDLLLKIARIDNTYVELEVDQVDIHEIDVGHLGELAFVGRPDLRFPFTIDRIEPVATLKEGKNIFLARAAVNADFEEWWRPGMGGTAKIDVGDRSLLWILTHDTSRFLQRVFWL